MGIEQHMHVRVGSAQGENMREPNLEKTINNGWSRLCIVVWLRPNSLTFALCVCVEREANLYQPCKI